MKFTRIHIHQSLAWFLATASLSILTPIDFAQSQTTNTARGRTGTQIIFNAPPPPADQGAPVGRARGGASRGDCPSYESLTALVPTTDGIVWSLTTSAHPTLWFYLPGELPSGATVEFIVQDQADNYIYKTEVQASLLQEGLAKFSIPENGDALALDIPYQWTLAVYCNPLQPSESVFVNGTIRRVALDARVESQIAQAEPLERVRLYAENGIWHDALDQLAIRYQAEPNNAELSSLWSSLLQQAALDELSLTPFAACCTLTESDDEIN